MAPHCEGGWDQKVEGEGIVVIPAVSGPVATCLSLLPALQCLADQSVGLPATTSEKLTQTPHLHSLTLNIESVGPSTVMILSCCDDPSILILAPLSSLMELTTHNLAALTD